MRRRDFIKVIADTAMSWLRNVCPLVVIVLSVITLVVSPAAAQQDRDAEACAKSNDPDTKIAACTRIINRPRKTKDERVAAFAYGARALAYQSKNELNRAITDFDQAIS